MRIIKKNNKQNNEKKDQKLNFLISTTLFEQSLGASIIDYLL